MSFTKGRGGARIGAGRPRKRDAGVRHARRPELSGRHPVHVTVRVRRHVWNLRTRRCFEVVCAAFVAGCNRFGMRVVGMAVEGNHLHLLIEAANALALTRGMKGLLVRIARGLNRRMGARGAVVEERFHVHPLRTPREVRAAMHYISGNTAKHARQAGRTLPAGYRDPFTVGHFGARTLLPPGTEGMVVEPETWLLRYGWSRGAAPETAARSRTSTARARRVARAVSPDEGLLLFPGNAAGGGPVLPEDGDLRSPGGASLAA